MLDQNPTIPIIILNINGLTSLVKRYRLSEWIIKARTHYMIYETHVKYYDTNRLKVNWWKKI